MKTLKIFTSILASVALLSACSQDDEVIYNGKQVNEFSSASEWLYAEPGKSNDYPLEAWLLKPAESDTKISVKITKSTRPVSFYINGANYVAGDQFDIIVPKGQLKGSVNITTAATYYNPNFDTLAFELLNPVFGRDGEPVYLRTKTEVYVRPYCPVTSADLQTLVGTYHNLDVDIDYQVTAVIGDTLVIDGLYNTLKFFSGITPIEGYPLKFVVNRSAKPITVTVAANQPFFVTTVDGADATIWASASTATGTKLEGSLFFCDKQLRLEIARFIPNSQSSPAGVWSLLMQKK